MSVIDHRAEAEALLGACDALRDNYATDIPWAEIQAAATLAQVHATLAGPSTRTIEFVSRPPGVDQGWRDLLSAARTLIAHAVHDVHNETVVILPADFDALAEQVNEAAEAGL